MRRRILHLLNWNKYQARSDKELPWLKLWGRLFKTPWFQLLQDDEKFVTITMLDLARQFHNNIPEELIFKGYLKGNYGIFMNQERISKLCKYLSDNDFLSDNCPTNVEVEGDKIRVELDKIRDKACANAHPPKEEVIKYFVKLNKTEDIALSYYDHFTSNGWKVGGRATMRDWQAAARNWARNSDKFTKEKPKVYGYTKDRQPITDLQVAKIMGMV